MAALKHTVYIFQVDLSSTFDQKFQDVNRIRTLILRSQIQRKLAASAICIWISSTV